MACSTDGRAFDDPNWCVYANKTILYCDNRYPLDCFCNATATFNADADIAGLGIIISFVATAWFTCLVALLSALFSLRDWYHTRSPYPGSLTHRQKFSHKLLPQCTFTRLHPKNLFHPPSLTPLHLTPNQRLRRTVLKRTLVTLCDLQLITGSAILIAGAVQVKTITAYHQALIGNYWNLTLNSFWAARACDLDTYSKRGRWNVKFRSSAMLANVVLAVWYQVVIIDRQWAQWDFSRGGYCFHSHNTSGKGQNWLWVAGVGFYATVLAASLSERMEERRNRATKNIHEGLCTLAQKYDRGVSETTNRILHAKHFWLAYFFEHLAAFARILGATFWWLLLRWLALWGWGDDHHSLEVVAYVGFASWNTFDIVDLKISNRHLVIGSEWAWGFGQVLPLALLGMIALNVLDSWEGEFESRVCGITENSKTDM